MNAKTYKKYNTKEYRAIFKDPLFTFDDADLEYPDNLSRVLKLEPVSANSYLYFGEQNEKG